MGVHSCGHAKPYPGPSWGGGRSEVKEETSQAVGGHECSPSPQIRPATPVGKEKASLSPSAARPSEKRERYYFAVGITNSAPLAVVSGQRCMMDFCLV